MQEIVASYSFRTVSLTLLFRHFFPTNQVPVGCPKNQKLPFAFRPFKFLQRQREGEEELACNAASSFLSLSNNGRKQKYTIDTSASGWRPGGLTTWPAHVSVPTPALPQLHPGSLSSFHFCLKCLLQNLDTHTKPSDIPLLLYVVATLAGRFGIMLCPL